MKLYYGTNFYTTTASFLTDEVLNNFIYPWPKMDSYIRKENGKLLVDIIVRGQDTAILAKLKNNEWIVSNDIFDRNYDDTKLEVFDKYEEVPILQIMLFEDVVILNGVFYKEVKESNILKLNDSVGIQRDVLDELGEIGIGDIKCRIEGRGIFDSTWSDWMQPDVWQREWKNHGLQRFMQIKKMKKVS